MLRRTKKILELILSLTMILSFVPTVLAEDEIKITYNGEIIETDTPPVIVDGRTLIPARVITEALGGFADWNEEYQSVYLANLPNSKGIILHIGSSNMWVRTYAPYSENTEYYFVDGLGFNQKTITLDVPAQIINDRTMIPVRAVSEAMDMAVDWDEATRTIILTEPVVINKSLVELGIVSEEDLNKGTYITTLEALETIERAKGSHSKANLSEWYCGDTLAAKDYLDDDTKVLLLGLCNYVLTYNEIAALNLESDITNYEALLYIARLIGDTYGCTESPTDISADTENIYEYAYEKGLISDTETNNANDAIEREEFYNILHKALFVEYKRGGYAGVGLYRLIDRFTNRNDNSEPAEQTEKEEIELSVSAEISDDLTVKWTMPEEYSFLTEEEYYTTTSLVEKDGTVKLQSITGMPRNGYEGYEIIRYLIRDYNKEWSAVRCSYYKSGEYDKEYYFDIDISDIKIVIEGDEVNPGTYTRGKGTWPATELSLSGGDTFEKGCYYVLKSYEKTYRKQEYNSVSYEVFKAVSNGNTFKAPTNRSFGVSHLDEIHIQKVTVKRASNGGYILSVTPESTGIFTVVES